MKALIILILSISPAWASVDCTFTSDGEWVCKADRSQWRHTQPEHNND